MSSKRSRNKASSPSPQNRPARPAPKPAVQATGQPPAAAQEESAGNPNLILGVVIVVALFMAWYYHLTALQQMRDLVGLPMLDHHFGGYGQDTVNQLRSAMDADARGQLSWVHKTAGTIFSLAAALATTLSIGLHAPRVRWRKAFYALPVAFTVVAITQNIVVDELLGAGDNALLGLASTLTVLSWIVLGLCLLATLFCLVTSFVREFRRRWADPSLQQPGSR